MRFWMGFLGLLLVVAGGCGSQNTTPKHDTLAGHYEGTGGGAPLPIVRALTNRFSELHPGVTWSLDETSSDAAIALVSAGHTDLGWGTRDLKDSERAKVQALEIGATGTAVAVHAGNPVSNLTTPQVRKIYAGEITDWADLGGMQGKIRVLAREKGAASRTAFDTYFFRTGGGPAPNVREVFESDEMVTTIRSFRDSIGMLTLDKRSLSDPQVKLLAIDGVEPTLANVLNGSYPVRRPMFLISGATYDKVKPALREFMDFVGSEEGQRIIAHELISV